MPDVVLRERIIPTNGVELRVVEAGEEGPLVILAHGFPELAYSWRHQIGALAAAGYRVVAPDQRGYGDSSRPDAVEAYDIVHLTADLIGILDHLGEEKAVFVGHDWGSLVASHVALLYPRRTLGLVNMSVPHLPRGKVAPTAVMRQIFGDGFFYMLYFQEPGVADAELGRDAQLTMRRLLAGLAAGSDAGSGLADSSNDGRGFVERLAEPDSLPAWLSQEALDHYGASFARTGFTGGINWYRNLDRNWSLTEGLAGAVVGCPSLFIGGSADPVVLMYPPVMAHAGVSDHRGDVLIDGAGHWVQQEDRTAVNAALTGFLAQIRP